MPFTPALLVLRWWSPRDMDQLEALYQASFPDENWNREDLCRFANEQRHNNIIKVLVDASDPGTPLGTLAYTLDGTGTCRVRRFAVCPEHRRRGLATRMLRSITVQAGPLRRWHTVTARVREHLWIAQKTLVRAGFTFDPTRQRERDEEGRDYYVFTYQHARQVDTCCNVAARQKQEGRNE
jgi:ribosomal protein S18 acetylase RimI-like enzyme